MDLLLLHYPTLIEKPFVELLSRRIRGTQIFGSKNEADALEPARFLPLEYAVMQSSPPALYQSAGLRIAAGATLPQPGCQLPS